ncbi:MAG: CHAP domain-containing protein [Acetobacter sp.]|nr:CHAP domain-containing protein [Bacteroides sp.]MCM1340463.1 CHAP domain-containing protein [Acetobacter sp.]MCM1433203.1 CHAP domain-containing protein [Clostridiales bacterium]
MKLSKFVEENIGKQIDWDGVYGYQCVDLIDAYIEDVLELKVGYYGNAKTWWENRSDKWIKANFEIIKPKYKDNELKAGDIGIRTSGTWGHIFIVAEPTSNGVIRYYDQNADGNGAAMTLRTKAYSKSYVNGILRPKVQSKIGASAPVFKAGKNYTLTENVNVRKGAGINYSRKKRSQLTADGKKNAQMGYYAVLKKGTRFTALEIKKDSGDIWIRIPSGWICVYYKGDRYAK